MWEGWTKNLFPLVTWPGQRVTRELLSVIPWIPLLCLLLDAVAPGTGGVGLAAARRAARELRRHATAESFPGL